VTTAKRAGRKPKPRTVTVTGPGEFSTWECTARADFPARLMVDLQSGNVSLVLAAFGAIVVEHNFPNVDGEIAATLEDVDPYTGLTELAGAIFEAIGRLPPR